MEKFAVIESMTIIQRGMYKIRVWRNEDEIRLEYDNADLYREAQKHVGFKELITAFAKMPRVNAVEVLKGSTVGAVVYPSWP